MSRSELPFQRPSGISADGIIEAHAASDKQSTLGVPQLSTKISEALPWGCGHPAVAHFGDFPEKLRFRVVEAEKRCGNRRRPMNYGEKKCHSLAAAPLPW